MLTGIAILVLGGLGYLVVRSFWGLLALRAFCGAGHFLMGAGAMAQLVVAIPAERSGQAFGLYSVAILVAYGVVPAAMDGLVPHLPSAAHGYAAATAALLPAAWIVLRIRRRRRERDGEGAGDRPEHRAPSWAGLWSSVTRPPVALLLLLNTAYFMNWSSLYYLYKGFAEQAGLVSERHAHYFFLGDANSEALPDFPGFDRTGDLQAHGAFRAPAIGGESRDVDLRIG